MTGSMTSLFGAVSLTSLTVRNGDVIEPVHFFFMVQISPKDSECIVFRSKAIS